MLEKLPKYKIFALAFSICFFIGSLIIQKFVEDPIPIKEVASRMESDLHILEKDFYELVSNISLFEKVFEDNFSEKDLAFLINKPYSILVCQDKQVVFWNNHSVVPSKSVLSELKDGTSFLKLKNGFYQVIKKPLPSADPNLSTATILAIQLIRYNYEAENKYLSNAANPAISIPKEVRLSDQKDIVLEPQAITSNNDSSFYIFYDQEALKSKVSYLVILFQVISIILLLVFLTLFAIDINHDYEPIYGFLFLLVTFAWTRLGMLFVEYPFDLEYLHLFQVSEKLEFNILNSPGNLFITVAFTLWVIIFFHKKIHIQLSGEKMQSWQKLSVSILLLSFILFFAIIVFNIIKSLVLIFDISFYVGNIIYFNAETFVGLACLALLLISFFLVCQKIAVLIEQLHINLKEKAIGFSILLIPYLLSIIIFQLDIEHFFVAGWLLAFLTLINSFSSSAAQKMESKHLIIWVFFFALFASFLLFSFEMEKENQNRIDYAQRVNTKEDNITEYLFESVAIGITEDDIIKRYYTNPLLPYKELEHRIKRKYLGGHFDKYDPKIFAFNRSGSLIKDRDEPVDLDYYTQQTRYRGLHTKNSYLYLISTPTGGYNYLSKLPIFDNVDDFGIPIGYLVIELSPKSDRRTNVYPELIIEDRFRPPAFFDDYSYGIYKNGLLESYNGDYPYNYKQDSIFISAAEYSSAEYNNFLHIAFQATPNKTVIVSKKSERFYRFLSLFSHLFTYALLALLFIFIINIYFQTYRKKIPLRQLVFSSLSRRINFVMLFILILTFLTIGLVTVIYFYQRSSGDHEQRLAQKQSEVLTSIENTLKENNKRFLGKDDDLEDMVADLSEVHAMDINLYDTLGVMLGSSQPAIFDKGLISDYMEPNAYYAVGKQFKTRYMHNERIGALQYLASYIPIQNELGDIIGFLNLPYFAKEKEFRSEISAFLVALINVYVLIMLSALALALFLSNSITNPLKMISEKLKDIRLGQKNELLYWPDNDEIGALVNQYNKTIAQLDKSARMLAQSEREYAWQQMAKQVAHEIKNPLTPMKLSIQHLQRAHRAGAANINDLTDRVSNTLIEQIDTLSRIASEFSSFAKMPESQNELLNVTDIVENAINLYQKSEEHVRVHKRLPAENCFTIADRNQLVRVFNNLIKNAIQAIPYDRNGFIIVNMKKAKSGRSLLIGVIDNGVGISQEQGNKVFAPNFTTKNSGMGLGLAMAKNIIEQAGGKIWFESVVNEGTTFYIKLPLAETPDPTPAESSGSLMGG